MPIIIYTIPGCPKCSAAKALLKRKGVSFREENVQADSGKMREMTAKLGSTLEAEICLPMLDISGTMVQGFEKEKILGALKEKGLLKE
ncbi:MAG: glutaredoxin domain-containing protein [archaeon]